PPQRAWKIPPKTVVYTTSMSNGVNSDHSSPIDDPLYRPQISRRVMFQRSTRCCTRLRTICRGLMGWLFEVTSALSEDKGGLYQPIGIGGSSDELRPCHTTRHAGPHRAVREVEVKRASERLVYRSGLRARRHSRRGRYCSTSAGSLPPRIERQRSEPQGRATPGTSSCLASIA